MVLRSWFIVLVSSLSEKKPNANLQVLKELYFIKTGAMMAGNKLATRSNAMVMLNW